MPLYGAGEPPDTTISSSLVVANRGVGIIAGAAGTIRIEGVVVRGTLTTDAGLLGRGIEAGWFGGTAVDMTLSGSVVEQSRQLGVAVFGAHAELDGVAIRDTQPEAEGPGYGLVVQNDVGSGAPASATARNLLVQNSHLVGVFVSDSTLDLEDSTIDGTTSDAAGALGDGIDVQQVDGQGTLTLLRSIVRGNARAGVAAFSATASVGGSRIECNPVPLNGESLRQGPFHFEDLGGNQCLCGAQEDKCSVLSAGLTPPGSIGD